MFLSRALPSVLLAACVLPFAGCKDKQISSYRVKKEDAPANPPVQDTQPGPAAPAAAAPAPNMASTPVATAQGDGLTWTAPSHWTAKPASAMRRGSFSIAGSNGGVGDVAITAFPGSVGGNLANVNRWRGQVKLPPIGEAELDEALTHFDVNGLHIDMVDLQAAPGQEAQRILGAIIPFGEATWFVKLSGPDALVAGEKSAFVEFLKTVKGR